MSICDSCNRHSSLLFPIEIIQNKEFSFFCLECTIETLEIEGVTEKESELAFQISVEKERSSFYARAPNGAIIFGYHFQDEDFHGHFLNIYRSLFKTFPKIRFGIPTIKIYRAKKTAILLVPRPSHKKVPIDQYKRLQIEYSVIDPNGEVIFNYFLQ